MRQIIDLYSELVDKPSSNFGWAKCLDNAKANLYEEKWLKELPYEIWQYCVAVGNPFSLGGIKKGSSEDYLHITPNDDTQKYIYFVIKKL